MEYLSTFKAINTPWVQADLKVSPPENSENCKALKRRQEFHQIILSHLTTLQFPKFGGGGVINLGLIQNRKMQCRYSLSVYLVSFIGSQSMSCGSIRSLRNHPGEPQNPHKKPTTLYSVQDCIPNGDFQPLSKRNCQQEKFGNHCKRIGFV